MNILGLKITSHDTGAALISGDKVVAIAEERLNRVKHSKNMFPTLAIDYCLNAMGIEAKDVAMVVIDQVGHPAEMPAAKIFKEKTNNRFVGAAVHVINHHDAHAASAFFCSPFDEAAVLVIDGSGEKIVSHLGMIGAETESLYRGVGSDLVPIQKTTHVRQRRAFRYSMGIGKLYSFISEGYLNFGPYNEGKMMGLAPYGTPDLLKEVPFPKWFRELHGHVLCNPHIFFPGYEAYRSGKKIDSPARAALKNSIERIGLAILKAASEGKREFFEEPKLFEPIHLKKARRDVKDPLPEKHYADVAYAAQKVLEEVVVAWGRRVKAITGVKNLCVAGGVGLNIDANKRFFDDVGFERVFIQPAATDTGVALGCALYGAHMIAKRPRFWQMKSASLGKVYGEKDILGALEAVDGKVGFHKSQNVFEETARLISDQKIIGWYQDGSEYGPRALGNRSILVDARSADMKDIVNNRVKHRESWRPFAASILAEDQAAWFDLKEPSPFMLLAAQVRGDKKKLVPSIVHIDGTCRIQSVTSESNEPYYKLLSAFKQLTGVPLVLNTSFNVAGEPIVETPSDALRCFLGTNFDYLILGDYVVTKK